MSRTFCTIPVWAWAALAFAGDPPPPVKSVAKKAPGQLAKDLTGPIAIHAAGKPIDVDVGHAAPCVADFLGDGTLHLLVGQFGDGKLRIYRNEGTKAEPRFGAFTWFDGKVPSG
jgi:hypothetical protein